MKKIVNGEYVDLTPEEIAELTPTLEQAKALKLGALADQRWSVEVGGMVMDGLPIATDRATASILTAAYVTAKEDPDYSLRFKLGQGQFTTLTASTIIAIATLVRLHIQACFDREDELTDAVLAADSLKGLDAIDITTGWPE